MGLLDGKVAVITGAGSGMAKASTKLFVAEGAKCVAADISGAEKDTAAEIGAEHGDVVLPVHCDVTQEDDVAALFEAAVAEFGKVDAILNVAGIGLSMPLHKFDMSAPEQNALPAPVTTTTRISGSPAISSNVRCSAPSTVLLSALRRSGRFSVTMVM